MAGGGDPFYLKFWVKLTPLERKRQFSIYLLWHFLADQCSHR